VSFLSLLGIVLFIEAVALRKGLSRMGGITVHRLFLVWLAVGDQLVIHHFASFGNHPLVLLGDVSSCLLGGAFLWANRHLPGAAFVAAGGATNLLAMTLNGGIMPSGSPAAGAAGHENFAFLGNVFVVRGLIAGTASFSVGEVVIGAGVAWLVYRTCKSPHSVAHVEAMPARQARVRAQWLDREEAELERQAGAG
jgi:hypothetical protein